MRLCFLLFALPITSCIRNDYNGSSGSPSYGNSYEDDYVHLMVYSTNKSDSSAGNTFLIKEGDVFSSGFFSSYVLFYRSTDPDCFRDPQNVTLLTLKTKINYTIITYKQSRNASGLIITNSDTISYLSFDYPGCTALDLR